MSKRVNKSDKAQAHIAIKKIVNEVGESKTLQLYFTDYIYDSYDWWTGDSTNMVQDTIDQVNAANPDKIDIIINSLGGDVGIGLAIYNFLKNYDAEITVEIIGYAASIASIIAMCADKGKLKMARTSFMVIHAAWSVAAGNAAEMRNQADILDKITKKLADVYANRSGKSAKYFTDLWEDGDYWFTPEEALAAGLCDEIFNTDEDEVAAAACIDFSKYKFKNIPAALMPMETDDDKPVTGKSIMAFITNKFNELMNFKKDLNDSVSAAKTDPKYNDVQNRDKVLDMINDLLSPIMDKVDAAIVKNETATTEAKPAETTQTETPAAAPATEQPKPAETTTTEQAKPAETAETAENKTLKEIQAQMAALKKQNEDLSAAIAAAATKPGNVSASNEGGLTAQVEYA